MVENSPGVFEIVSPAKVNLFLDVLGRRPDGYHDITGLFQTISFHDTLRIRMIGDGLRIESTRYIPGENTLKKAYDVFRKRTGYRMGLEVRIVKRIPMRAGFGGGSSNAASLLRFLGKVFKVPRGDLVEMASEVGSDVPFFLEGGTAIVRGRGEEVVHLEDLPRYGLKLAVPKVRMDTARAYSYLKPEDFSKAPCDVEDLYRAYLSGDREGIRGCSYNVFQEVLKDLLPEIGRTLSYLEEFEPIVSMMTGSGTGCFAVFEPGKGDFGFLPRRPYEEFLV